MIGSKRCPPKVVSLLQCEHPLCVDMFPNEKKREDEKGKKNSTRFTIRLVVDLEPALSNIPCRAGEPQSQTYLLEIDNCRDFFKYRKSDIN